MRARRNYKRHCHGSNARRLATAHPDHMNNAKATLARAAAPQPTKHSEHYSTRDCETQQPYMKRRRIAKYVSERTHSAACAALCDMRTKQICKIPIVHQKVTANNKLHRDINTRYGTVKTSSTRRSLVHIHHRRWPTLDAAHATETPSQKLCLLRTFGSNAETLLGTTHCSAGCTLSERNHPR